VAAALAVSMRTVDTLISHGGLKVVRLGKSVRFRQEDIEAFNGGRTLLTIKAGNDRVPRTWKVYLNTSGEIVNGYDWGYAEEHGWEFITVREVAP
jgi:excisionase family DNA binding protein